MKSVFDEKKEKISMTTIRERSIQVQTEFVSICEQVITITNNKRI